MNKSAIKNQILYVVAKEQYMKPLLEDEYISEEVYNDVLKNLYDELEVWRHNRIQNPGINVSGQSKKSKVRLSEQYSDYVSLTELARNRTDKSTGYIIQNWLRDKNTVNFLTLWESKHNSEFLNVQLMLGTLTPKIWIQQTKAIGIVSRQGKNGGTYAHKEIALQFMCRISAEMMLKVIQKYLEDTDYEENN